MSLKESVKNVKAGVPIETEVSGVLESRVGEQTSQILVQLDHARVLLELAAKGAGRDPKLREIKPRIEKVATGALNVQGEVEGILGESIQELFGRGKASKLLPSELTQFKAGIEMLRASLKSLKNSQQHREVLGKHQDVSNSLNTAIKTLEAELNKLTGVFAKEEPAIYAI